MPNRGCFNNRIRLGSACWTGSGSRRSGMGVGIAGIAFHLPAAILDNAALARHAPRFQPDKVKAKTGIDRRHIAAAGETAGDLATEAARKLLAAQDIDPA